MSNTQILIYNIRNIMQEKGLKQCAVAKKMGIEPKHFSSMLNGRKLITAEYIPTIAKALNININELFENPDEQEK